MDAAMITLTLSFLIKLLSPGIRFDFAPTDGSLMCCGNAAALLGAGRRIKIAHIYEVRPRKDHRGAGQKNGQVEITT